MFSNSLDYELDEIEVSFPDLDLDEIYATNQTIVVRSGNNIYKSTNDGESWYISLESNKKLLNFSATNEHTLIVSGENGTIFRSFDYGESWFEKNVAHNYNLVKAKCRNINDCLALSEERLVFHTTDGGNSWIKYDNYLKSRIYDLKVFDGKYYFTGQQYIVDRTIVQTGTDSRTKELPLFIFDDTVNYEVLIRKYEFWYYDLELFNVEDSYFIHSFGRRSSLGGNTRNYFTINDLGFDYEALNTNFSKIEKSLRYVSIYKDNLLFFGSEGEIYYSEEDSIKFNNNNVVYDMPKKILAELPYEFKHITQSSDYLLISSNDSKILKVKIKDSLSTNIETNSDTEIQIRNNHVFVKGNIDEIDIYDTTGRQIYSTKERNFILDKGLYLLLIKSSGIYNYKKVLVK